MILGKQNHIDLEISGQKEAFSPTLACRTRGIVVDLTLPFSIPLQRIVSQVIFTEKKNPLAK